MDRISFVIIEDEIPAAEELKYLLSQFDTLELKGLAQDGVSGHKLIKEVRPQVAFLDINVPGIDGMELAKRVKAMDPEIDIIFITAYEKHALKAFEVQALDYILKPYDEVRIGATVERLIQKNKKSKSAVPEQIIEAINSIYKEDKIIKKIPCEEKGKTILINIDEVCYCFVEEDKVFVKTRDKKYCTSYNLAEIEQKTKYFRAHRSYLVNIDHVKELYTWFNGTYKLILNDNEKSEIPVSRNNVRKLKDVVGL